MKFRQRLVAMRYSHVRTDASPANSRSARQAASNVSLCDIPGVGRRAKHAVAVQTELAKVRRGQRFKSVFVTRAGTVEDALAHRRIMPWAASNIAACAPFRCAGARCLYWYDR